jgi:surfeit locus 1 family protein
MAGLTLRRRLVLLATLAAAALTARLGLWQLDRVRQKTELQAQIDARGALPPLPQPELARDAAAAQAQTHRRVALHGRWLAAATVHLDNRSHNGRAGFLVVTPLLLDDGAAVTGRDAALRTGGDAVLVQRGWSPRDAVDPARLAPLLTPEGPVEIDGLLAPPPSRLLQLGDAGIGPIRQNLDLEQFAREIRVPLLPLTVQQLDRPGAAADGLQRQWPAPAIDVGTNRGYAVQWFALCALIIGLYVWFELIAPRRLARSR